jgi:ribosomal protein S6
MTEYELFYLVGESKETQLDRIKGEVAAIVTAEGGSFLEGEKLEKRKLAYLVNKEVRGTYIARRFTLPGKDAREESVEKGEEGGVSRITHKLNLYRDVLRFIIVRAEGLPSLTEEEGTAKVVAEMTQEERVQKAAPAKKVARKSKTEKPAEEKKEEVKAEEGKEEARMDEAEIDKKLEEVLNL